ncbi:TonB-dependent receptor [Rhodococcus sp. SRB_17]|uniref:TonB-dependent receptor n=1 Tax=Acidovorax sp. SRB_24 TaxID=1962700 RepID=UPI00145EDCD2|nr:TonB-dependent receptor [Acidovorax sp. SRB_24]NMM77155.1 TonB-dependent receptor [Acidovorax sp. SRB_24]NMM88893.1 TonB-dependent receptor [Rhodococcus sp. SRB_17]
MRRTCVALGVAVAVPVGLSAQAQTPGAPAKELGVVTVTGGQPTSLPTQIPTTMEGITREQIAQSINATDSEDALKYFPSLLVRKRYIGDYNHAILSSRASGTGNSARSAVYADGILLSNYLGNGVGGLSFPPRWGLVTPEEIERVDVMYGPFSAAYPGNSVGAVVDYVTRMPTRFEAHGKVGHVSQPFALYGTDTTLRTWQASTSVGNRHGDWAWFLNFHHTDSEGQPLTFATRLVASGTPGAAGQPVTGAVPGSNNAGAPWLVLGSGTAYRTRQDHIKAKVAYDVSPTLRAAYTFGLWQNRSEGRPMSYLRNAAGQPVNSGAINIDGRSYAALTAADFALTNETLMHTIHGLSVKSHTQGVFDWEVAASLYDYGKDLKRQNGAANTLPAAALGGPGTVADGSGTGWTTLALKGTWRPDGVKGAHTVDFGFQQDSYRLAYLTSDIAGNWSQDAAGALASAVGGRTRLHSLYAQDAWAFAPRWKAVLGARAEHWSAFSGSTRIPGALPAVDTQWPQRAETHVSPKAALSWQWRADTVLKGSAGRAVRFPTVGELYGATSTANAQYLNDPNLRPEKSWTHELSAEKDLGSGLLRLTFFAEDTRDALYAQTTLDPVAQRNVSRVQNVGRIQTQGLELAYNGADVLKRGLDLSGSVTYADSVIRENAGFAVRPGDTVGKRQPNVARWRATALASYRWNAEWSTSVGARYSGPQFRTLDNSDVNGFTYMGVSRFFTVDLRARYQVSHSVSAALGVDNANNYQFWNFHPYPQRSYVAELKIDL